MFEGTVDSGVFLAVLVERVASVLHIKLSTRYSRHKHQRA